MEECNDPQLSQSATDVDVQIELPGGGTEMMTRETESVTGESNMEKDVGETPVPPGIVQTPKKTISDAEPLLRC